MQKKKFLQLNLNLYGKFFKLPSNFYVYTISVGCFLVTEMENFHNFSVCIFLS